MKDKRFQHAPKEIPLRDGEHGGTEPTEKNIKTLVFLCVLRASVLREV